MRFLSETWLLRAPPTRMRRCGPSVQRDTAFATVRSRSGFSDQDDDGVE